MHAVPMLINCEQLSHDRPGRLRLRLQGGSLFVNFDLDYFGIVALDSISHDGFGCCRANGHTTRMSASDSQMLLESAICHQLDSPLIEELLRRYFGRNAEVLWRKALLEHDLL